MNYINTLTLTFLMMVFGMSSMQAQCEDWLNPDPPGGWTNFNGQFGGAPCDDGDGCPFLEITGFEVYAAEAYTVNNFVEDGTYSFSICNGPGAGTWVPDFTIIAPSGAVDAFGAGDGDGCTITWTASESGTYTIVINEAGQCGGGTNTATDNGFPALTCVSSPETLCEPVECSAGTLTTTGSTSVCDETETFALNTDNADVPTGGGFGWVFSNVLGGTGALNGDFILTGADMSTSYDSDLNGVLSANNLDLLEGTWVIKAASYENPGSPFASICEMSSDSLIVHFGAYPTLESIEDHGDGSATVTVSGGTPPYTYSWSDGQTTQTATGLESGTHEVEVSDANGCTITASIDVVVSTFQPENLLQLTVGPNPSAGFIYLVIELYSAEVVQVQVMDLMGRVVHSNAPNSFQKQNIEIDLGNHANGIYLINISIGDDQITRKVLLSR